MTDKERKEAIIEVLEWVKSGKQDLQNGAEEIDTLNYIYTEDQEKQIAEMYKKEIKELKDEIKELEEAEKNADAAELEIAKQKDLAEYWYNMFDKEHNGQ